MEPLRKLFEDPTAAPGSLPPAAARLYGGGLELAPDLLYCNFVSSLDGVVALGEPGVGDGPTISGRSEADHVVMAVLRALADCVVVGAGTLRADHGHLWTPGYIYPALAAELAPLGEPRLVVVTASGHLEPAEPALQRDALVITTEAGAARLRGKLAAPVKLISLGSAPLRGRAVLDAVRAEGHRRVLTEGGPRLLSSFVADGLLDELFLTLSPLLAGRGERGGRLGLLEGVELLPGRPEWWRLRSARGHASHLFLRYTRA